MKPTGRLAGVARTERAASRGTGLRVEEASGAGHRLTRLAGGADLAARRSRRLAAVMAVNIAVVLVEVGGGLSGHSTALLADAGHNVADVGAAGLALVAVRLAERPPTGAKSFGYHRSGVLAALLNAAVVLVLSVLISVGAAARLARPVAVQGSTLLGVGLAALVLNGVAAAVLAERGGRDFNIRATVLHMVADAASSGAAATAGAVLLIWPSLRWLDPTASLLIAGLVAAQAVHLGRQVADVLLEGTPEGTDTGALVRTVVAMPGIDDLHDLHIWSLSAEVTLLSAHIVMAGHPTLEEAQELATLVRARLAEDFGVAHATLELECETCAPVPASPCAMVPEEPRNPA